MLSVWGLGSWRVLRAELLPRGLGWGRESLGSFRWCQKLNPQIPLGLGSTVLRVGAPDPTGCSLFLWEDEDEGRKSGMEKMRSWGGGHVKPYLGTSNPRVHLSKLLLSSCEWLFLCEDQRIHPIPHSSCTPGLTGISFIV